MELPFLGDTVNAFVSGFLPIAAMIPVLGCFIGIFALVVIYIIDVSQNTRAIRRNHPVVGRFRYFFDHLGEFFRTRLPPTQRTRSPLQPKSLTPEEPL